ncbi:MAG: 3-hydroxybutyrate dehydrogenase [Proteobacteria bacterium]|jgi:3-hydroxybutyrate dehydrogenase|nr:3-hydroxybutyrate dehydrogenase [Pseudomonadota bacterium]
MLKDHVALVTGSTSGIGLGIAEQLAAAGAHVVLNGFADEALVSSLKSRLGALGGGRVEYDGADMRDAEAVRAMVAGVVERHGRLDILVNNAGIQHVAPVEDFPIDKWNDIIAINLSSAFHASAAAIPAMKAARRGRIIMMASAHALAASPFKAAYVAAKHGIAGLTKTIALELAEFGVTCNAICPGYVLTPLVERQIPDTAKARGITEDEVKRDVLLAAQPTKDFVTIAQVASLALYLCRPEAAQITGTTLSMDGGWTAK